MKTAIVLIMMFATILAIVSEKRKVKGSNSAKSIEVSSGRQFEDQNRFF